MRKDKDLETTLVPLEEKTVNFYGDEITAALVQVGAGQEEVYVPIKPISDYLGLSWSGQFERLKRDTVLSESLKGIRVTRIPLTKGKRSGGGTQEALSLPLKFLPGWLFGLDANRVKPELKEKIIKYQRECYDVLWRAFKEETLPFASERNSTDFPSREPNPVLVQLREQGLALAKMGEEQWKLKPKPLKLSTRLTTLTVGSTNSESLFTSWICGWVKSKS